MHNIRNTVRLFFLKIILSCDKSYKTQYMR